MKRLAAPIVALSALAVLTACSSDPAPADSSPSAAAQVIAPIIVPFGTTTTSVPLNNVVVITGAPADVTAESTPAGIVEFVPGGDNGSFQTNPGLQPLKPGDTTVTFTAGDGQTVSMEVTVTDATGQDGPDLPANPAAVEATSAVIGKSEDDAKSYVENAGLTFRVGRVDDEMMALTRDFRADRITVEIDNGKVTSAVVG